jgi:hypothetical protein
MTPYATTAMLTVAHTKKNFPIGFFRKLIKSFIPITGLSFLEVDRAGLSPNSPTRSVTWG